MPPDTLSLTFAALADPTRRAILKRLASGTANVKELSRPFDMSGPAVCKHLRVLERAGLIRRGREAQSRPCRLEPAPLKQVVAWAEAYRAFWDASFDRLDGYLQELHAQRRKEPHARRGKEARDARRRTR
jgi:DNA-binding transcriptional ArsR family regulator